MKISIIEEPQDFLGCSMKNRKENKKNGHIHTAE